MVGIINNQKLFQAFYNAGKPDVKSKQENKDKGIAAAMLQNSDLHQAKYEEVNGKVTEKLRTKLLPDDPLTKLHVGIKQARKLPEYAYRGLKGDPDANFFEFLQLSKIAYWSGGPTLIALFGLGRHKLTTMQKCAGAVGYYALAAAGKAVIDVPVKLFRKIDLNHPYKNVVSCRAVNKEGFSPKKVEYHSALESHDFTRFDLFENNEDETAKDGRLANKHFDKMAKAMGIDAKLNDSDSTVKTYMKRLVATAKTWQYLMIIPFSTIAIAMSKSGEWGSNFAPQKVFDEKLSPETFKKIYRNVLRPIGAAFKEQVWDGKISISAEKLGFIKKHVDVAKKKIIEDNRLHIPVGKIGLAATAAMIAYANYTILKATSGKHKFALDFNQFKEFFKLKGNIDENSIKDVKGDKNNG